MMRRWRNLRTLEHVNDVYPMIRVPMELKFGETTEYTQAAGIPMSAKGMFLERTRGIGIMKAIGGSDSDVRRISLIEASASGVLGGITGLFLGWLVGRIIHFGANQYIVSQGGTAGNLFSLPIWLIAAALGFAVVVSLAAGAFPARRAARLDPIQALRHD